MKKLVNFQGVLHGEGHEALCTVTMMEVTLPGTNESTYSNYSVKNVSKQLPDGQYQLLVRGEAIRLRHYMGNWLAA